MEDTIDTYSAVPKHTMDKQERAEYRLLKLIQDKYKNFHPALVLAELAQPDNDDQLRFLSAKALLPYVAPQLKSIEVRGNVSHDHGLLRVELKPEQEVIDIEIEEDKNQIEVAEYSEDTTP